jgi:hemolysin III
MPSGVDSGDVMDELVKPRFRGVSHQWAFFVALAAGVALVIAAPSGRATLAALIYAISMAAMFGASALYHRIDWKSLAARRRMRRLDHSMIFLLIAGTYTPFALLVLDGSLAKAVLIAIWTGAALGIGLEMLWPDTPKWLTAAVYVLLGWVAVIAFPELASELGVLGMALVAGGGVLYTAGAVIYALRRPDPAPAVFGYHEIFHVLVIAAAVLQFVAVAAYALPKG